MKRRIRLTGSIILMLFGISNVLIAQNRNFITSLALGIGNSGLYPSGKQDNNSKTLYNPVIGLQFQKKINTKWAFNVFPNMNISGNESKLYTPSIIVLKAKSVSTYLNLALHPKYYLKDKFYLSAGPEISYLVNNYGSTYDGDKRLTNIKETKYYHRFNLSASASIGFSTFVQASRKNAPVPADAFWFVECRIKRSMTKVFNEKYVDLAPKSHVFSIELLTGISIASKK